MHKSDCATNNGPAMEPGPCDCGQWRVGSKYGIHVYEGDRPVATFLRPDDAKLAVEAVNAHAAHAGEDEVVVCEGVYRDSLLRVLVETVGADITLVQFWNGNLIALPPLDGHRVQVIVRRVTQEGGGRG